MEYHWKYALKMMYAEEALEHAIRLSHPTKTTKNQCGAGRGEMLALWSAHRRKAQQSLYRRTKGRGKEEEGGRGSREEEEREKRGKGKREKG